MDAEAEAWSRFIEQCVLKRKSVEDFQSLARVHSSITPITSSNLAKVVLKNRSPSSPFVHPLVPRYIERLVLLNRLEIHDVLLTLLECSPYASEIWKPSNSTGASDNELNRPELIGYAETTKDLQLDILHRIARLFANGQGPQKTRLWKTIRAISQWMTNIANQGVASHHSEGVIQVAIGTIFSVLAGCESGSYALATSFPEDIRKALGRSLSLFIPVLSQASPPLAAELESIQKQYDIFDGELTGVLEETLMQGVDIAGLQFQNSVSDGPTLTSRAGLYIYLNAVLVGRSLGHDTVLINYLNARYKGDVPNLVIDLITASFDVLSSAMYRNEPSQTMFLFRSYLVNKLPLLLTIFSTSMFPPFTIQWCIAEALGHVDPQAFLSLSQMFGPLSGSGMLSDVRQEFLFACALHDLIAEESIGHLLGETPMQTLPAGGRYSKEDLVNQCTANPERVEDLVGELDRLEGNSGAIAGAVVEIIQTLCATKETISLKALSGALSRRHQAPDVLLLFHTTFSILQPLCHLLDNWRYDADQGECQPVYDEFGSILLFILTLKSRYDLDSYDLGITDGNSFITRLVERGWIPKPPEDMSELENQHFSGWITSLYETEGISDEAMSTCSPQDFYLLVPTIFSQSLLACQNGVIDLNTLRGGFEYLLEPFLLPSLVSGLTWLTTHLWEAQGDTTILIQVIRTLVMPNSISGEAQAMHSTVLSVVAESLEHALRERRRVEPSRSEIDPIIDILKPHLSFKRNGASYHTELETWTSAPGGLIASIRNIFQSLILWATAPEMNMTTPTYTHRQLLAGVKILGARHIIHGLVEEVKLQTEHNSGDLALEIATAMICAPTTAEPNMLPALLDVNGVPIPAPKARLSLVDALKLELDDSLGRVGGGNHHTMAKDFDRGTVETIVRLHRKVEAQLAGAPQVMPNMMPGMNLDAEAAVVAAGTATGRVQLDLGGTGTIDDVLDAAGDEMLGENDFLGLDTGEGMDLG
ncbi:MAG: mediator complex subunit [Pleopsidium flavum]|nr:MAG: mediator complex subunit [Pleopsidium flavum]